MDETSKEIERALDAALEKHLPRYRPSAAFERRLRERLVVADTTVASARGPALGWRALVVSALRAGLVPFASALGAAALVVLALRLGAPRPPADDWSLVDEAVSDHLRVVASTRPPEIESGGIHQVKPWFTGRVDFAPRVAFAGDDDFPLVGGSLGYVRDHKAAVFQFRRRLHAITLLVFPAAGVPWPGREIVSLAGREVVERASRGFSVLLWRDADLGYALVSDVARAELETLVPKITPPK
jgi:anti-sigma factor RsiW